MLSGHTARLEVLNPAEMKIKNNGCWHGPVAGQIARWRSLRAHTIRDFERIWRQFIIWGIILIKFFHHMRTDFSKWQLVYAQDSGAPFHYMSRFVTLYILLYVTLYCSKYLGSFFVFAAQKEPPPAATCSSSKPASKCSRTVICQQHYSTITIHNKQHNCTLLSFLLSRDTFWRFEPVGSLSLALVDILLL